MKKIIEDKDRWNKVKNKILDIIIKHTGYPKKIIKLDYHVEKNLGIDSLKQITIINDILKKFNMSERRTSIS